MKKINIILLIVILTFASSIVQAEDAVSFMNKVPTSDELVEALAAPEIEEALGFGGIKLNKKTPGKQAVAATAPKNKPRVILDIKFEYDSDQLTAKAKQTLNALGKALNSDKLQQSTFVLEGHTDASGSESYNLQLSKRRAQAAAKYLQTACNVKGSRLVVKSYGESRPLNKTAPESGDNRRVEVVNVVE